MLKREGHKSINSIVSKVWPEWNGELRKQPGGWNNTTYIVEKEGRRAVLRIYNTHRDRHKIDFEHDVLQKLGTMSLPFQVPLPILTSAGETLIQLEEGNGKFACLFKYIEGASPSEGDADFYESFGEAAGTLSVLLADVNPELPAAYLPYYELGQSYPLCTRETIRELYLNPPERFIDLAQELKILCESVEKIEDSLWELKRLPHQLVHGDLNASNLLVTTTDHRQVAALLDFEFCTYDVRAMEAAVILSGLLGNAEKDVVLRDFWRGYSRQVRLSSDEIEAIPILILLRKMDVFLHFLTRYLEGTDEADVLREHVKGLAVEVPKLAVDTAGLQGILMEDE
ncbi:aminoglycoside phosphotransferase [Bacillus sp. FJAT-27264]|uniref:phosphotransferase n=1 Tax=Paenibacillus sp. (strain DSM 101736 / FJAT-27264) TaxID=1850362 RepID=UPI0008080CD4|nr:phosphotransferase [Bacillus sp. FJAT-27264]OBZ14332.1 aminoglycoside phosphotransferase [Bacillus sp. FJAT-27264]